MKVIGRLQAIAGFRETVEEYAPEKGVILTDLVNMVRESYAFQSYPGAEGNPVGTAMVFANGRFGDGNDAFGVPNLIMEPTGDIVMATTTDQAEVVLNDLVNRLDEKLGFRLKESNKDIFFVSNIVIDMDDAFEAKIGQLNEMTKLIMSMCPSMEQIGVKRLAFGKAQTAAFTDQISLLQATDFLIETRAGTKIGANRYYSSAPMRSADHVRALEAIEAIALGKVN